MNPETERSDAEDLIENLVAALLTLKNEKEGMQFLKDIFSEQDLERIPKRWQVIRLLLDGHTHRSIRKMTGASLYMISRANRAVVKGGTGIVKVVWERLDEEKEKDQ